MPEFTGVPNVVGGGLPDSPVTPDSTALMIIDMQYVDADRHHGMGAKAIADGLADHVDAYFTRLEQKVVPNIRALQDACRASGLPVVHVRVMNLAGDGSDTSWRYKQFGLRVAPGTKDAEILEELAPLAGEVVISKTTSNVFVSTNADFVLRNMGIDTLIVCGVVTNNCVESSTRGAADIGYRVLLPGDACAAWTDEGHEYALRHLDRNFALVTTTAELTEQIAGVRDARRLATAV